MTPPPQTKRDKVIKLGRWNQRQENKEIKARLRGSDKNQKATLRTNTHRK